MNPTAKIRSTVRNTKRVSDVFSVLISHGFENVLIETGLGSLIAQSKRIVGLGKKHPEADLPRPVRLRMVLEELGPTFIKLGQILSTRPDLIPLSWAEEFKNLQSDTPKVPYEKIKACLSEEFGERLDDLFESIEEEPLAAASIAQVHRAVLKNGQRVVIKVVKPGIKDMITADMEVMITLANIAEHYFSNLGYSPVQVSKEFSRELQREVNLIFEAQSTDRLRQLFAKDARVQFSEVYWDATTPSVLTMQEAEGTILTKAIEEGWAPEARRKILENGADAIFKQCLEHGFFHADPHPGNIFAKKDGTVWFIDCGMTGRIERRTQDLLADLVVGVAGNDLDTIIDVCIELGEVDPRIGDDRVFRKEVADFIAGFQTGTLESLDIAAMLQDFFELLRQHQIQCPADLVFLIKALGTVEGVGEALDPEFNLLNRMRPYIEKLVKTRYGPKALAKRSKRMLLRYAETAERAPRDYQSLMYMLKNDQFRVNLEHQNLDKLVTEVSFASKNVAAALIIAATLVGSAILASTNVGGVIGNIIYGFGILGFTSAVISVIGLVIYNIWHRR